MEYFTRREPSLVERSPEESNDWREYLIDIETDPHLVQGIESVLNENPWKARVPIPLAPISPEALVEPDVRVGTATTDSDGLYDDEGGNEQSWSSAGFDRGFGSHAYGVVRGESY